MKRSYCVRFCTVAKGQCSVEAGRGVRRGSRQSRQGREVSALTTSHRRMKVDNIGYGGGINDHMYITHQSVPLYVSRSSNPPMEHYKIQSDQPLAGSRVRKQVYAWSCTSIPHICGKT